MHEITMRNYRPDDLEALVNLINEADAIDKLERATILQELEHEMSGPTSHPETDCFLAWAGDQLVGRVNLYVARGDASPDTETIIYCWGLAQPRLRRHGVGRRLLVAAYQRATEYLHEVEPGRVSLQCSARDVEEGRQALYASFGMKQVRYFVNLARPLNGNLGQVRVPDGIRLRTIDPECDAETLCRVANTAFRDDRGHTEGKLEEFVHWMKMPHFRPELWFLAEEEATGSVVGLGLNFIDPDWIAQTGRQEGYVDALAVLREYRKRGVGTALLVHSLHALRRAGMEGAHLHANADNLTGAMQLNRRVGFSVRKTSMAYQSREGAMMTKGKPTVTQDETHIDRYEYYEALFDPLWAETRAPRGRAPNTGRSSSGSHSQIIAELTDDMADLELGFHPTYRPSRYEESWLLSSLRRFYDEGLITDVLNLVKGGKEASVYCCRAHPATGLGLLAAKVYRPRMFRNLRNDKMYRQGREVLTAEGRPAGKQAGTIARAIRNKTPYGRVAQHTSWLMHEFTALESLYQAGAAVPRPISSSENAVLMSYHGDTRAAAPTLNAIRLGRDEAALLFQQLLENIDLMLKQDLVHGDLSAYNILYWEGEITIIDLPQVVNLRSNTRARAILRRDIQRTCEYFATQGVECEPAAIMDDFWNRHVAETDPMDVAADWSRLVQAHEEMLSAEDAFDDRQHDPSRVHP